MDPAQLQMMQQVARGQVPGIPGTQAPLTIGGFGGGGASMLSATTQPGMSPYVRAITGNAMPDTSPLAPIQPLLNRFGVAGAFAGLAGNAALTGMMEDAGVMPTGNAGSYMQAYHAREFQKMQQEVAAQVAGEDAEGIYRTFRGGAALAGMPFNIKQRQAARSLANTIAEHGPMLAMAAPELLDAISGERGSIQAMSGQMMEANRYRIDPSTGQMGYGAESNADLIDKIFNKMFAGDNVARMQGLRAGDMGQLYRSLAPEGAVGPQESLRDRTLMQLIKARDADQLEAIGTEAGVDVSGNLAELSNEDLTKLRGTNAISSRMTDADARQISDQLQDYVGTLSAIREVFGENGNPNAPIPQLINALETLTSGQMHKFDSNRLNTMVRDMQSLTQLSGKSIDQYMAMRQTAAYDGKQLGIGTTFATTATNVGITTGMAFADRGGATGFGALSREEAEQASMSLFNRGMASEMSNALGALGRIEAVNGFADNDSGKRLSAIMAAARAGENTYFDPVTQEERNLPTQEAHFRSLITAGGVEGMSRSDFNMMLGDRTSNLRMMHSDPGLQQAAFNNQAREINKYVTRQVGNRLSSAEPLMDAGLSTRERNAAARSMGSVAIKALNDLSPADAENKDIRNRAIADALLTEAGNRGIELSDQDARIMAVSAYGQAENGVHRFGFDTWTAFSQVLGEDVTESRKEQAAQSRARAGVNDAMSSFGPQGTIMQRVFTSIQRQGDKGGEANLSNMLMDIFGADMTQAKEKLMPEMQAVADEKLAIDGLRGELEGASPEKRRELERQIATRTVDLKAKVAETQAIGRELGIGGGSEVFNLEDMHVARKAARNLENFNRIDQVRMLAADGDVTEEALAEVADKELTSRDFRALGVEDRKMALVAAEQAAAGEVEDLPPEVKTRYKDILAKGGEEAAARIRIKKQMRDDVGTVEEFAKKRSEDFEDFTIGSMDEEEQKIIVRQRRTSSILAPTKAEIATRIEELNEGVKRPELKSLPTAAQQVTIRQDVEKLEEELDEASPERRVEIKKRIEDRKAALSTVTPEQQQALSQEIEQLESKLAGATPEKQEAVKQEIESYRMELLGELTPAQQTLAQEIETRKVNLASATVPEKELLVQEIAELEAEFNDSRSVRQLELSRDILELESELEGPTPERRVEIQSVIDSRKEELAEQKPLTPAQQKDIENEVVREFGFESYEAYESRKELTPERRVELEKEITAKKAKLAKPNREDRAAEDYAQSILAEDQLLAEKQLQTMGLLTEGQTLRDDVDDFEVMSRKAPELQAKLQDAKAEDRAGIVSKYFDLQVRQKFYSTETDPKKQEAEIERNRVAAREALGTPEGRRALKETRANLATLADTRREFLMDEDATVRLGSAVALDAITRSREAEMNLQDIGNDYYGGSRELMYVSGGTGMTVKGAKRATEEFLELTTGPKTEAKDKKLADIAARMSADYEKEVSVEDLNTSTYKDYIASLGTGYVTEMREANETLAGGVDQKAYAERLGVTEDQLGALQKLTKLEADDFSESAKKLGITEEKYRAVVRGEEELDPSLRLFKGEDAAKQLREARADNTTLLSLDKSIEKMKADVKTSAENQPDGIASPNMVKGLEDLIDSRAVPAGRQAKAMKAAGLDPGSTEDKQKFQQLLEAQGEVQLAETRTANYESSHQSLLDSGETEEDIDIRLGKMKAEEIKAQEDLKAIRALDLGSAGEFIAKGLGIAVGTESDELTKFQSAIKGGGESHQRNLQLVAGALDKVKNLAIGEEDATPVQKLDDLTDQYIKAKADTTGAAMRELAMTHQMGVSEMDSLMNHTGFLGMGDVTPEEGFGTDRMTKALGAAMNTDIAAQVAEEEKRQMEITGTVNVTGVITGEGTFEDSSGRTVR